MNKQETALYLGLALTCAMTLGCGGDGAPTRESQCRQVLDTFCKRAATPCTLLPAEQVSVCVEAGVAACCNGMCGAKAISTQAEINTCEVDIRAASCASLDVQNGGSLPPRCNGVVRSALASTDFYGAQAAQPQSLPESIGRAVSQ